MTALGRMEGLVAIASADVRFHDRFSCVEGGGAITTVTLLTP